MESLFKRYLILFILIFPLTSSAYKGSKFEMRTPEDMIATPKMFGSDVMFLKKDQEGEGAIFVKLLENPKVIDNYSQFLLEKIKTSKTIVPMEVAKVSNKKIGEHQLYYTSYKDRKTKELVFTGMIKKNKKEYLFLFFKDSHMEFKKTEKNLLKVLNSLKFKLFAGN